MLQRYNIDFLADLLLQLNLIFANPPKKFNKCVKKLVENYLRKLFEIL